MNEWKNALWLAVLAWAIVGCGKPEVASGNRGFLVEDSIALKDLQREYPSAKVSGWLDRGGGDTLRLDSVPVQKL